MSRSRITPKSRHFQLLLITILLIILLNIFLHYIYGNSLFNIFCAKAPDTYEGRLATILTERAGPTWHFYQAGFSNIGVSTCIDEGRFTTLLVIITSAVTNLKQRMAIRDTWAQYYLYKNVSIIFALGATSSADFAKKIELEQNLYGDMIVGNSVDVYESLPLKTLSLFEYAFTYCGKAKYLLKTDDDMFINIKNVLNYVEKIDSTERAIHGRLVHDFRPVRSCFSPYYLSYTQYAENYLPDFVTGPAYLLPINITKELYYATLNHSYFKLEDVLITGFVAGSIDILLRHSDQFINKFSTKVSEEFMALMVTRPSMQYCMFKEHVNSIK